MLKRLAGLVMAAGLGFVLLYVSRFWIFDLWSPDGLLGIGYLRPQGNLLSGWLRGTPFPPFDLLIWSAGGFLLLSLAESLRKYFR
ncbi:MAG: hypothetical protein RIC36_11585 [Rhodospirillales bacterium]